MAHFAKLDEQDTVLEVIVVDDAWLRDDAGVESEARGIAALLAWSGHPHWAQTSYNSRKRVRYAGIGFTFDRARDAFIPPRPFASWVLDEGTLSWAAPVPMPSDARSPDNPDGPVYVWDETAGAWAAEIFA